MTVFYLLMTNSNLASCASLSFDAKKQCYWTHLTLGNPLIIATCYAVFAVTYLLCVWKVYRDHPHTKQDSSVCFKQCTVLRATDRTRADSRAPSAETRFWTSYRVPFLSPSLRIRQGFRVGRIPHHLHIGQLPLLAFVVRADASHSASQQRVIVERGQRSLHDHESFQREQGVVFVEQLLLCNADLRTVTL